MSPKMIIALMSLFFIANKAFSDSLSLSNLQVKLLDQKISAIQSELSEWKQILKDNEIEHKNNIEKIIDEKNNTIKDRLNLYLGIFLALFAFIGGIIRYFGKDAIEKWLKEQTDKHLETRISDTIIDSKINALGKPIMEKLLSQIEKKKSEYDKLYEELSNKEKNITVDTFSLEDRKKLGDFSKILEELKEEKNYKAGDWNLKGREQVELKNYAEAKLYFTKGIEIDPTNRDLFNNLGFSLYHLGEYKAAIENFTKVIEANSKDETAYSNRGVVKNALEDYKGAIEDLTEAIKLSPTFSNPYKHRAFAHMKLKQFSQAVDDINETIKLSPNYDGANELRNDIIRLMSE